MFYRLYQPCGLFNQVTSLELAVGLSSHYDKDLVLHQINNKFDKNFNSRVPVYSANYAFNDRKGLVDTGIFPRITDLIDWTNKERATLIDDSVDSFTHEDYRVTDLLKSYLSDLEVTSEDELKFSEGREKVSLLNYNNVYVSNTLGYYSRFFYSRSKDLDNSLASVRFKKEYYELAQQIAESIGNFNGAHFRLTDHKGFFDPNHSILDQGLSKLKDNLPIVMCTDQPNSDIFKKCSYGYLLLDDYILNNFYKEFRQLEFKEEVSFGILNNLVMHHSKDFVGSPGSTFTGYIYRGLNQIRNIELNLFGEDRHIQTGPYSWNGYINKDIYSKQWWREWKESRLNI